MKRFKDVNEALALFEYYENKRNEALAQYGDSKTANRCFENIKKIVMYLKCNDSIYLLERFHNHPNIAVRVDAAILTLPLDEKKSLRVLKEIVKMNVRSSLAAETATKEWKNGNLKPYLIGLCTNQEVPEMKIKKNALKELVYRVLINVGLVACKENQDKEK